MALIRQTDRRTGTVYVYEAEARWDPEKKQSRYGRRKLVGHVDPRTGEVVPNRPTRAPSPGPRREFYGACALLDAAAGESGVAAALGQLDLSALDLLVIENVGNLVCPAEFALGEDAKAVALSITEGDDKPLKYPLIFKESAVALLNKVDILPYTNFDMEAAERDITALHPGIEVLPVSCRTGEGLTAWQDWLRTQVRAKKKQA